MKVDLFKDYAFIERNIVLGRFRLQFVIGVTYEEGRTLKGTGNQDRWLWFGEFSGLSIQLPFFELLIGKIAFPEEYYQYDDDYTL